MLARYGRGQSLTAGRRIRRSPQRSAQRINLLSVGFGPVQPLQFTGRAGAVCSGAGRAAEGADVVGSPPGCHLLDKHLRSMLLDLLLAALADRGEPAALLLGLPEFFLLLPAFGRCGTAFETAQKVSQACFQGPPCAVAAGVPGPVPTAGRRTQSRRPLNSWLYLGTGAREKRRCRLVSSAVGSCGTLVVRSLMASGSACPRMTTTISWTALPRRWLVRVST